MTENMALWETLGKTDPAHTKGFKRAGGFSGTALKPMWVWQCLTRHFGPCGTGWGMEKPSYDTVPGHNGEILVFCTVEAWYLSDGERKVVFGEGGDKVVTYIKANEQYNRPERWENDDEAFKKAFTDALMNAFKFVGVGADIHMGLFDDNKYVQQVREEFAQQAQAEQPPAHGDEPAAREKLDGKHKSKSTLKAALKAIFEKVRVAQSLRELEAIELEFNPDLMQCQRYLPLWWNGDPDNGSRGWVGMISDRRHVLGIIESMLACDTKQAMQNWLTQAGDQVDALDDIGRREFEAAWSAREAEIEKMDLVAA